jgi:putative transposase
MASAIGEAVRSLAEDEEHLLMFYEFPKAACIGIFRQPMPLKVSQSNVRQRTDQIDVFTTETSCLAIVWATMQDIRLHPHLGVVLLRIDHCCS